MGRKRAPARLPSQTIPCGWCRAPIAVRATGRLPKWCSPSCRQHAWQQRRAAASGLAAVEVVDRFIEVEKEVTVVEHVQGSPFISRVKLHAHTLFASGDHHHFPCTLTGSGAPGESSTPCPVRPARRQASARSRRNRRSTSSRTAASRSSIWLANNSRTCRDCTARAARRRVRPSRVSFRLTARLSRSDGDRDTRPVSARRATSRDNPLWLRRTRCSSWRSVMGSPAAAICTSTSYHCSGTPASARSVVSIRPTRSACARRNAPQARMAWGTSSPLVDPDTSVSVSATGNMRVHTCAALGVTRSPAPRTEPTEQAMDHRYEHRTSA